MSLNSLVYVSSATKALTDHDLQGLLKLARAKNAALDVTGLLLYRDGFFMQALEGEEDVLDALFESIKHDPRHEDVLVVYKKPLKERKFAAWSMGFNKIDDKSLECVEGFCDFIQRPKPAFFMERAGEAEALLDNFKTGMFF
ncbi:MAG: BLUF domain-containing protein [Methylophilaceae bacterium]